MILIILKLCIVINMYFYVPIVFHICSNHITDVVYLETYEIIFIYSLAYTIGIHIVKLYLYLYGVSSQSTMKKLFIIKIRKSM